MTCFHFPSNAALPFSVLMDGTEGDLLNVCTYDDFAFTAEDFFNKAKHCKKLWVVFSGVYLSECVNSEDELAACSHTVKAGMAQDLEAQMWLFASKATTVDDKTSTFPSDEEVTLNSCTEENKFEVCAVVWKITKCLALEDASRPHMVLDLVDPSCLDEGASWDHLRLHLFFESEPPEHFKDIVHGDVLQLRDMEVRSRYRFQCHYCIVAYIDYVI